MTALLVCLLAGDDAKIAAGYVAVFPVITLRQAVAGAWREPANVARDEWRHPEQTLSFFGVQSHHTVMEITPGTGWYAEILVPFLSGNGH